MRKRNNAKVKQLAIFILCSIFIGAAVHFYRSQTAIFNSTADQASTVNKTSKEPIVVITSPTLQALIGDNGVETFRNQNLNRSKDGGTLWVSNDNWNILIERVETSGFVHDTAFQEIEEDNSLTQSTLSELDNFFSDRGFTQSKANSSSNESPNKFRDYIRGWTNNNEICLLSIGSDISSFFDEDKQEMKRRNNISVSCTTQEKLDDAYASQIPILRAINDRDSIVAINHMSEILVTFSVHSRLHGSGASGSAYKQDGIWRIIEIGQALAACEELVQKRIPEQYWRACMWKNGEISEDSQMWKDFFSTSQND